MSRVVIWTCLVAVTIFLGYLIAIKVLHPGGREPARNAWFADPRLTYDTPFENVRPDVKYVGDKACAECHPKETEQYHKHPMGRSAFLPADVPDPEPLDAEHHNPFTASGFQYLVRRENGDLWQEARLLDPDDLSRELASVREKV